MPAATTTPAETACVRRHVQEGGAGIEIAMPGAHEQDRCAGIHGDADRCNDQHSAGRDVHDFINAAPLPRR